MNPFAIRFLTNQCMDVVIQNEAGYLTREEAIRTVGFALNTANSQGIGHEVEEAFMESHRKWYGVALNPSDALGVE